MYKVVFVVVAGFIVDWLVVRGLEGNEPEGNGPIKSEGLTVGFGWLLYFFKNNGYEFHHLKLTWKWKTAWL